MTTAQHLSQLVLGIDLFSTHSSNCGAQVILKIFARGPRRIVGSMYTIMKKNLWLVDSVIIKKCAGLSVRPDSPPMLIVTLYKGHTQI